jgi:hypothetical protein
MHRAVYLAVASLLSSLALSSRVLGEPADEIAVPSLGEQLRRQWTIEDIEPKPESKAYLRSRDDAVERLSLREAVAVALQNNPGIAVERLEPRSLWRGNPGRSKRTRSSWVFAHSTRRR